MCAKYTRKILFKNIFLFFIGEREIYGEKGETERSCIHWFTPQMVTMAAAELI